LCVVIHILATVIAPKSALRRLSSLDLKINLRALVSYSPQQQKKHTRHVKEDTVDLGREVGLD
jgi:hypothetical protein